MSASPTHPAFVVPPEGSPAYYGFQVLDEVEVEGFRLGKITDFEAEPSDYGDAFVVAPDNSRAGLVWEVDAAGRFEQILSPDTSRWGVWSVSFPYPMIARDDARRNLRAILPQLKQQWERWKKECATPSVDP